MMCYNVLRGQQDAKTIFLESGLRSIPTVWLNVFEIRKPTNGRGFGLLYFLQILQELSNLCKRSSKSLSITCASLKSTFNL